MRLKEIAELLNEAQADLNEWLNDIEADGTYDEDCIEYSRSLARKLGDAATIIEGELL